MELSKSKMSLYGSLGMKKMRKRHGLFMVEGEKSVADLLGKFELEALLILNHRTDSANKKEAYLRTELQDRFGSVPVERVYDVSESEMKKISALSTPSAVAAVFKLPEEITRDLDAEGLCLMLDGVQDPGNLGTIIRTAHWFGIKKIFASPDTADIFNPKTIQSTMGSLAAVEVIYAPLEEVISANPTVPVYGLLLDGKNIYEAELGESGFIIMGNEGKGISEAIRKKVTHPLLIPPYNPSDHSESLNVAIATAITLSVFRQPQ